jgi:Mrp family chromosome partitioning ATPase
LSRNFELLYQSGKMQELLQSQSPGEIVQTAPQVDTTPSTPAIEMGEEARNEISRLVHSLFRSPNEKGPRRIVFAGNEPGCGCSWMCAHVAEVLASQVDATVCVMDGNLRSPGLHQQFGVDNHHGLSELLQQSDPVRDYLHQLPRRNLWLLSCGSGDNRQASLGSPRMRARIAELSAAFDYLLIDVASLKESNDAIVVGGLTDGVVLVLKANASRREVARRALYDLQAANVNSLGAVLNPRKFPIPNAIYNRL